MALKVYLDSCCYNRPFDTQTQLRITMETQAKLMIQEFVSSGNIELVSSFVVAYEQSRNPFQERKESIINFIKRYATVIVDSDKIREIRDLAGPVMETGIKRLDAYHIACALYAGCNCLLSVDDRLLKYRTEKMQLMNPIDFIKSWR
ncbi:MAG: type II toxin-antitoxin system VapC family toxin [Lachnospiraceae bacterium]|nr:type II toxin-antitoxin system VapC family toxin [Lachnospiraceae bacterium]